MEHTAPDVRRALAKTEHSPRRAPEERKDVRFVETAPSEPPRFASQAESGQEATNPVRETRVGVPEYLFETIDRLELAPLSQFEIEKELKLTPFEKAMVADTIFKEGPFDKYFNFLKEAELPLPPQQELDKMFNQFLPEVFYDFVETYECTEEEIEAHLSRLKPHVRISYEKLKRIHERMMSENDAEIYESLIEKMRNAGDVLGSAMVQEYEMTSEEIVLETKRKDEEQKLYGRIKISRPVGVDTANTPYRVWFEDEPELSAIAKSRAREFRWLRFGIPQHTYADREWLAYHIARALAIKEVPTTIFGVTGIEGLGSIQKWENGTPAVLVSDWENEVDPASLERIAVMHLITGITDGHEGNFLVSNNGEKGKREMYGIDFGLIFSEKYSHPLSSNAVTALEGKKISQEVVASIRRFQSSSKVQQALYTIFELALHEDAPTAWRQFQDSLDLLVAENDGMNDAFVPSPEIFHEKTKARLSVVSA